jgi:hypothetical protein
MSIVTTDSPRKSTQDLALAYIARYPGRFIFPIKPGAKFPPLVRDNLAGNASNDPEQIKRWHKKWFGCNWGVAHRKSNLMVIDVDTNQAKGKVGQQTYDLLDLEYGWPETEITTTPSGGHHHIYEGEHVMALGEHGIGKDIDSPNYSLIPGCTFDNGTSYIGNGKVAVPCPQWIYDLIRRAKVRIADAGEAVVDLDQPANIKWAEDFLRNDAPPAIEGNGGEHTTLKVAMSLRDNGISEPMAVELMNAYYNVPGLCDPEWEIEELTVKVHNAYTYANLSKVGGKTAEADFSDDDAEKVAATIKPHGDPEKISKEAAKRDRQVAAAKRDEEAAEKLQAARLAAAEQPEHIWTKAELCERWVYIMPTKLFVCRDPGDPNADDNARKMFGIEAFDRAFEYVGKGGRISTQLLMKKKGTIRRLDAVVYRPEQPEFIGATYNLYRPSPVVPSLGETDADKIAAQAALKIWKDHLQYLFPLEADRALVLNWISWLLQNMGLKPKHALLIQGSIQGTGKSFIAEVLERILDPYNVTAVSQTDLAGQFNRWAMNAKLLVIEELRALDKREVANKLHPLITQERIPINDKNEKTFNIRNCFGIMAMTNDEAAVPIDDSDRRYLVVRTDATPRDKPEHRQYDPAYYVKLYALLKQPTAMAAIAYELLHRDVGTYNGQGSAPMTAAKLEMMEAGADDIERWMVENDGMPPLNGRLVCIADIINIMPGRLTRSNGVEKRIAKVLKRKFKGFPVGKVRLGGRLADQPRLWTINDGVTTAQIKKGHRELAAIYMQDRAASAVLDDLNDYDDGSPAAGSTLDPLADLM